VKKAVAGLSNIGASDIELTLPSPSYTINTLTRLKEIYPQYKFSIVMGSDGLSTFQDWKEHDQLEKEYLRFVYPRNTEFRQADNQKNVIKINAPLIEVSSTFIRESIRKGKNVQFLVPCGMWNEIRDLYGR
jgi:nicotinate-nucleotide adenylyltransferase